MMLHPIAEMKKKKKKKKVLSKEEKKQRDRERLKQQQRRRKEKQRQLEELIQIQAKNEHRTEQWQKMQEREQMAVLEKIDIDKCRSAVMSPVFAGYELVQSRNCHPIFRTPTIQYLNSRNPIQRQSQLNISVLERHSACRGYEFLSNDSNTISPVFFGLHFFKIECTSWEDDDEEHDQEKKTAHIDPSVIDKATIEGITMEDKKRNMFEKIQKLLDIDECPVCASNDAPGCPGCWNPCLPPTPSNGPTLMSHFTGQRASYNIVAARKAAGSDQSRFLQTPEARVFELEDADEEDEYDSGEEELYIESFLKDRDDVEKYRAETKNYIDIVIKAFPAGNAVRLKLDTKDTIQYMYELYRANFDDPNRKIFILLPTTRGVYYFDPTVVPETDFSNAITKGHFTLEDYNLRPGLDKTLMLISVSVLHPINTPVLLEYFIRNNFRISGVKLQMKYVASTVPKDILQDRVQIEMEKGAEALIQTAAANRQMTIDFEKGQIASRLKELYDEKMQNFLAEKAKTRVQGKTKRELRAFMYFKYATERHLDPFEQLHRLWNCFQKFEELKLMKSARLLDAFATDTVRELLASHSKAAIETFRLALGYEDTRLNFGIKHLGNGKLVLYIGDRLGLVEKEDRQYGIELDLDTYADDHEKEIPLHGITFKDIEWEDKKVTETMFGFTDLVIVPFYMYKWHKLARAYKDAEVAVTQAKQILETFNRLVGIYRSDTVLEKKSIKTWISDVESLQALVGSTGVIAQACRRLRSRFGSIKNRSKGGGNTQESMEDALGRSRLASMLSPDPNVRLDMTRRQSTLRSDIINDFRKRRETIELQKPIYRRGTIRQSINGVKNLITR